MIMSLKKELVEKIPTHLKQEPHFQALLDHVKEQEIKTKEHLEDFLKKDIEIVEKWLTDNKKTGATTVKTIRDKIVQLHVLKKCYELTQEFLL